MSDNSELIQQSALAAAAAGFAAGLVPGAAALDTPAVAGVWANMIVKIAIRRGRDDCTQALAMSVVKAFLSYAVGSKILTTVFSIIPGVHILVAGVNAALNYYYTRELGKATDRLLNDGVRVEDVARLAWAAIPKPSVGELRHIWSEIKAHV